MPIVRGQVLALVLIVVAGCTPTPPEKAAVSGTITLDGKPVQTGWINFFPADSTNMPGAGSAIVDGKYQIEKAEGPQVGPNRVEIRAERKTGKRVWHDKLKKEVDEVVDLLPPGTKIDDSLLRTIEKDSSTIDFNLHRVGDAPGK